MERRTAVLRRQAPRRPKNESRCSRGEFGATLDHDRFDGSDHGSKALFRGMIQSEKAQAFGVVL
jgi:hypothetical protein